MPEPINTSITGVSLMTLAVAVFGPQAGPYIVILLGSLGGVYSKTGTQLQPTRHGLTNRV